MARRVSRRCQRYSAERGRLPPGAFAEPRRRYVRPRGGEGGGRGVEAEPRDPVVRLSDLRG